MTDEIEQLVNSNILTKKDVPGLKRMLDLPEPEEDIWLHVSFTVRPPLRN